MDESTIRKIDEAFKRLKKRYPALEGLSRSEFARTVDDADKHAENGASTEEIIKLLEKAGVNEDQLLEALKYIEEHGVKKYMQSLLQKCIESYQSGALVEKIKAYLNKTKISEEAKARILADIDKLSKKANELRQAGEKISGAYNKGKKLVIGFAVLIVFLTASVIFLLIRGAYK